MMWKLVFPVLAAVFAVGLGAMVGAPADADINDPGVENALNYAVAQHNRGTNDLYLRQVAEVVKVQKQVVSGLMYIITVKMAKTPCRKDSANETQTCTIHQDPEKAQPYQCTFRVWSQPWLNSIRVQSERC